LFCKTYPRVTPCGRGRVPAILSTEINIFTVIRGVGHLIHQTDFILTSRFSWRMEAVTSAARAHCALEAVVCSRRARQTVRGCEAPAGYPPNRRLRNHLPPSLPRSQRLRYRHTDLALRVLHQHQNPSPPFHGAQLRLQLQRLRCPPQPSKPKVGPSWRQLA
jgi:hypothetical protein